MRKSIRTVIAAAVLAAPFAIGAVSSPAEATCDPRKPSTCGCPYGWEKVGPFCLPIGALDVATP